MKHELLGAHVEILSGFAFKSEMFNTDGDGLPLIRIRDVVPGKTSTFYSGAFDKQFLVKDGDILIGMDGEFNCALWRGGHALLNQRVCRVAPRSHKLDAGYLFRFLPNALKSIEERTPFATVKHLSAKEIRNISIPLPPLDEQRRIAAILDQADDLRRKRREALERLSGVAQAIFRATFGDPAVNEMAWPVERLSNHTSKIGSGATPTGGEAAYKSSGIPLIRSMNVHDNVFIEAGLAFIDEKQASRLDNVIVQPDDVLLNITGASVARVCRAPRSMSSARVNQHVSIIRPTQAMDATFLEALLLHPKTKSKLLNISGSGATREAITKAQIEQFKTIIPPLPLQRAFAARVAEIDTLKAHHRAHLARLDALFASLQHRAFRGDLSVPSFSRAREKVASP